MRERLKQTVLAIAGQVAPIDLLQQVRFEVKVRAVVRLNRLRGASRTLLKQISQAHGPALLVNLGCGPLPAPGWLNVDGVAPEADLFQVLGEPLSLPDACASMVFSEHVLEHIDFPGPARVFLREACRILRPGGHFRVIVPDAGRAMTLYANGDTEALRAISSYGRLPIEMVNRLFRENGFHRWAWDYALMERELKDAGFTKVRQATFRDSEVAALNIDFDEKERILQSLYVEAVK